MQDIVSRPYTSDDLAACLAIFDSNVPTYFAPEERADFCRFLESIASEGWPYLVLTTKGSIIGCGGLAVEPERKRASLAWGMVDKASHGQGLGTNLTLARLELARAMPDIAELTLDTSQHTHGFYEKFGFTVSKVTPDGIAPGLDRWDMTLRLTKA
ncbi:GNAT family N-acetyltransferase [Aminobacter sp. LjRoot7]|uniref:GNAT family N-acetyltransferase n=1 Tax=Aminobacter sp. LjRoot7 TaxID=3342335 RepID=UPI003ECCFA6F